ncbi:MAG: GntG family PLP-dependent aldolase [bacterium]
MTATADTAALDFRSDTVTKPTPAMYDALLAAPLGDDVLGHDPTVWELEEFSASRFGKEAALFFPSGTMANQAAVRAHTRDGDEILLGLKSHIFNFEVGGAALHARLQTRPIAERDGYLRWEDLSAAIRPPNIHTPQTGLICLENTHNILGGRLFPIGEMRAISEGAREAGIPVHLDGARIFNAQIASGTDVAEYAARVDSVMFCLSKGLASPVGSMLVGSSELMERCRKIRKAMGGGLRQAGLLAACGLVSMSQMVDRLAEDHKNARHLAAGLNASGLVIPVDLETVESNIVIAELDPFFTDLGAVVAALGAAGLACTSFPPRAVRFCTHKDVSAADVDTAIATISRVAAELGRSPATVG